LGFAVIIAVGIGAQWLSWRLKLPAILFLLVTGFVAGPVSGIIDPDALLGELIFPVVSLSVSIILFEGGLSLDISELRTIGRAIGRLMTVGVIVTWVLSSVLAVLLLGLDLPLAALFGAILVVTGPTVIIPLLRHIRPSARIGSAVKWEGIVNDPIGAILAVLVLDAIVAGGLDAGLSAALAGMLQAALVGGGLGLGAAGVIVVFLKRYWIPDYLQSVVALALAVTIFALSNEVQPESGLLAVTIMGASLASQKSVSIKPIVEFKANLRVLLISGLFIILAARLPLSDPDYWSTGSLLFLAGLIFVVRPVSVGLATWGTELSWRERFFLAAIAPRGIVAAAVASVFALELAHYGYTDASRLVPLIFLVIVGTVTVYGIFSPLAARLLRVATPNPQGMLVIGASPWVREIASLLQEQEIKVMLVDSNWANVTAARGVGLRTFFTNALTEEALEQVDFEMDGVGRLLALTPNDEVNALCTLHYSDLFDRVNMFQLPPESTERERRQRGVPLHLRGRFLFRDDATYEYLSERYRTGWVFKRTPLTEEFDLGAFRDRYGDDTLPLFIVGESGDVEIITAKDPPTPKPGDALISLAASPERET